MKPFESLNPDRFFALVDTSEGRGPNGDCHLWLGATSPSGAGCLSSKVNGRTVNFKAHRYSHWIHYGRMPDDMFCVHACGVTTCVNPRHLYLSPRKKGEAQARLMRLINHAPGQGPRGDCWEFQGYRTKPMGYGNFSDDAGRTTPAHRYMFEIVHGPLPPGAMVLHKCDNGACCNPEHLYAGDHAQNMKDRSARGRTFLGRKHSKLTDDQALSIKSDPRLHREIAEEFGVSPTTVSFIKRGKRWTHLPGTQTQP